MAIPSTGTHPVLLTWLHFLFLFFLALFHCTFWPMSSPLGCFFLSLPYSPSLSLCVIILHSHLAHNSCLLSHSLFCSLSRFFSPARTVCYSCWSLMTGPFTTTWCCFFCVQTCALVHLQNAVALFAHVCVCVWVLQWTKAKAASFLSGAFHLTRGREGRSRPMCGHFLWTSASLCFVVPLQRGQMDFF